MNTGVKPAKITFISLGCDKNLVDSEVMLGLINEEGYVITDNEAEADIIIINSCGFIMEANEEAIENVLSAAENKTNGRCCGIIVTGCMAQRYKEEIFKELPEVDAVVGTGDFEKIGSVIKQLLSGEKNVSLITDKNNLINEKNSLKRMISTNGGFAYLKIAEGCDNHCTYCTIPSLRGRYRSRHIESLIEEAEHLVKNGAREIILVAQDTSLYGVDLYSKNMLPQLLRSLSEINGVEWIRILYCYPENITAELIDEMAVNPKVCHYLDMPVQHGVNKILKLMGRRSSKEDILRTIEGLRSRIPDICIRTTVIVGFPQETESDFKQLCDFLDEARFDRLGSFAYSREEGTPAYEMPGQIDEQEKESRKERLLEYQRSISAQLCQGFIGKTLRVIVEGRIDEDESGNVYCGRSYRDCYEIDGYVFFESDTELISGEFKNVKITEASDYDLIGVITDESAE